MNRLDVRTDWTAPALGLVGTVLVAAVVLSFPLPSTIVLVMWLVGAIVCVLALWRPSIAIVAGMVVPWLGYSSLSSIAVVTMIIAIIKSWQSAKPEIRQGALLIGALGTISLLTGVWMNEPSSRTHGVALAVSYSVILGIGAALTCRHRTTITVYLIILGIVVGIAAMTTPELTTERGGVSVLGQNANGLGHITAFGLVAALTALRRTSRPIQLLAWTAVVLDTIGLAVTGSRGALVAAVAGGVALLLHRSIVTRPARAALLSTLIVVVLVAVSGPLVSFFMQYAGREETNATSNVTARESALQYAIGQGMSHPLLGIGMGRLPEVSRLDPESGLGLNAHNAFAGIFAESGGIALLVLLAICVWALLRSRKHAPQQLMPLVVTVLASGASLQWWGATRSGSVALLILGSALGAGATRQEQPDSAPPAGVDPAHNRHPGISTPGCLTSQTMNARGALL